MTLLRASAPPRESNTVIIHAEARRRGEDYVRFALDGSIRCS
jgi:hypothetical protein